MAVCEAGVKAVRTGEKVPVVLQPKPGSADDREPGITEPDLIASRP